MEEEFEVEPLAEGGARVFRKLHTPGFEGWTVSRYRQTQGRTPEGDPEVILEDLDADGVDAQVLHPNLSQFGLFTDHHEMSVAHARVYQRLRHGAVHAVLRSAGAHRAHRAHPPRRRPRRGRRDRAGGGRRVPGGVLPVVPQTLICQLIGGGVPERSPDLHVSLIEFNAHWLSSLVGSLDKCWVIGIGQDADWWIRVWDDDRPADDQPDMAQLFRLNEKWPYPLMPSGT